MPLTRFEYYPANLVEKIFWGRVEIMAATAFMYFTSGSVVQHSLHLLKYKGKKEIGIYFGRKMGEHLKQSQRFQNCESRIERWENMRSTFKIRDHRKIQGKHILLVDDVVTTGASLEACALTLLSLPGTTVSIACLAHTVSA